MKQNKLKTIKTGKFWGYDKIISTLKKQRRVFLVNLLIFYLKKRSSFEINQAHDLATSSSFFRTSSFTR